jgi:ankyrin repeat protein
MLGGKTCIFVSSHHAKTKVTPLHQAADGGHLDMVNFLLDNSADVNAINTVVALVRLLLIYMV